MNSATGRGEAVERKGRPVERKLVIEQFWNFSKEFAGDSGAQYADVGKELEG